MTEASVFDSAVIPRIQQCFEAFCDVTFAVSTLQQGSLQLSQLHLLTLRLFCWTKAWQKAFAAASPSSTPDASPWRNKATIKAVLQALTSVRRACEVDGASAGDLSDSSSQVTRYVRLNIATDLSEISSALDSTSIAPPALSQSSVLVIDNPQSFKVFFSSVINKIHSLYYLASPGPTFFEQTYLGLVEGLKDSADLGMLYKACQGGADPMLQHAIESSLPDGINIDSESQTSRGHLFQNFNIFYSIVHLGDNIFRHIFRS